MPTGFGASAEAEGLLMTKEIDENAKQVKQRSYKLTFLACVACIANQAVVASIVALLFTTFMDLYGFAVWQLGVFVGVNFVAQLLADIILTATIDKLSYRKTALTSVSLSAVGLALLALLPMLPFVAENGLTYYAMLLATVIFAFSGGMAEVIITPITDAIPDSKSKSGALALMHSFYAWGQVLTIVVTSLFVVFVGGRYWHYIVLLWCVLPVVGIILFSICPINRLPVEDGGARAKGKTLLSPFMLAAMLAIFTAGGTEIVMNQYVTTFSQKSLGFDKATSDLVGMGLFAVMMGIARTGYGILGDRLDMNKALIVGSFASFVLYLVVGLVPVAWVALVACVLCGFFSGLLWPGTLVVASRRFPASGAWVFAILAICGDVGASVFPTVAGFIADGVGLNVAFAISSLVPLTCFISNLILSKKNNPVPGAIGGAERS